MNHVVVQVKEQIKHKLFYKSNCRVTSFNEPYKRRNKDQEKSNEYVVQKYVVRKLRTCYFFHSFLK